MNNGYLRTADMEAMLTAAAAVLVRKGTLGEALEAAAAALRPTATDEQASLRTAKAPGDAIIGSTCRHVWQENFADQTRQCVHCREVHKSDCPATGPMYAPCTCAGATIIKDS